MAGKNNINFEQYIELVDAIVMILDKQGNIIFINDRGCEILECDKKNILGQNWFDVFIDKEDREKIKNIFNKIMKSKVNGEVQSSHYENYILSKKGNKKFIRWHNTLLENKEKELLSSGIDITELKKLNEDLEAKLAELEKINKLMIGRELRMAELKEEIKKAEEELDKLK